MDITTPIRGVNLGGWLVTERWITPALFDVFGVEDEYSLMHLLSNRDATDLLETHRKTFITEQDFAAIAKRGYNSVRLPVPWYVFGDQGPEHAPFIGCIEYVDKCLDWASAHGLSVLIDLHSAPGGQNGFDSSGVIGLQEWHMDESNRVATLAVLRLLAQRYADHPALFGIELLNEPVLKRRVGLKVIEGIPQHYLRNFYRAGYKIVRSYLDVDKAVVFHDAFRPDAWATFMNTSGYDNVWIDLHRYHCYTAAEQNLHKGRRLHDALKSDRKAIQKAARGGNKHVLIGEWSAGLSIEGGSLTPEGRAAFERVYIRRQLKEFKSADGWYFWTYKCESDMFGWDSRRALSFLEREMLQD